ncbi:MAG: phosphotransferase [Deltaproteobacteria bacterium]|nr:phosphotransferase [Deltaproteobacteria bacterium]
MEIDSLLARFYGRPAKPVSTVTLKGDASSRSYHRVTMPRGFAPTTLVVMELPEDALASDEAVAGEKPAELPFLNMGRHLEKMGLRVPEVYLDAALEGALLLEDLGDVLFADKVDGAASEVMRPWYEAAIDLLAEMHRAMWPIPKGCDAAKRSFDYQLLRWELDHYREWGIEALRDKPLSPAVRRQLDKAFDDLAKEVAVLPQGFVHRDYQSRNLMVMDDTPAASSLVIIDFQDALIGPRIYDLVALLNDSYIDISDTLKEEIVTRYAKKMELDSGELIREFHMVSVQRKLKDGGRFVFIDRVKGNPWFLPFVDGSFERVGASLARLHGHEDLKSALAAADPTRFQ